MISDEGVTAEKTEEKIVFNALSIKPITFFFKLMEIDFVAR